MEIKSSEPELTAWTSATDGIGAPLSIDEARKMLEAPPSQAEWNEQMLQKVEKFADLKTSDIADLARLAGLPTRVSPLAKIAMGLSGFAAGSSTGTFLRGGVSPSHWGDDLTISERISSAPEWAETSVLWVKSNYPGLYRLTNSGSFRRKLATLLVRTQFRGLCLGGVTSEREAELLRSETMANHWGRDDHFSFEAHVKSVHLGAAPPFRPSPIMGDVVSPTWTAVEIELEGAPDEPVVPLSVIGETPSLPEAAPASTSVPDDDGAAELDAIIGEMDGRGSW